MAWTPNYQRNELLYKVMERTWPYALAFSDVTVVPTRSKVTPAETDVSTYFSRNVRLKIPISSAAMDTVTDLRMLIGMAENGGIGILHSGMDPEKQAALVEKAKHARSVPIRHPITFRPEATVREILAVKEEYGYAFNSFPIVDGEGRLAGLVTGRHMTFVSDTLDTKVEEFMTRDVRTGPEGMTPREAHTFMKKIMFKKLPLVDKDGKLAGMYDWDDLEAVLKHEDRYNLDERGQLVVGAAVGAEDYQRAALLVSKHVNVLVVDTAHGGHAAVVETVRELKRLYPNVDVVGGNVSTADCAEDLLRAGADGIKVGQGPGSICTTRIVSGAGMPQITAIYDVAEAVKGEVPVIADGGIKYSGETTKAFVAQAQCVMLGTLLGGTDESPGEDVFFKGRKWKKVRGMGSLSAMKERKEARKRYRQKDSGKLIPEGVEGLAPYKGNLADFLEVLVGGLRAGMGYAGARTIDDLNKRGWFRICSKAGDDEGHPHDIEVTEQSPNYPGKHV